MSEGQLGSKSCMDNLVIPRHVGIIMDGNGRWAKSKGKLRIEGHRRGVHAVREAVSFAVKYQIQSLTLYAFSSENWSRPQSEIDSLMELFIWALEKEVKKLHTNNVKLNIIGDISVFNQKLQNRIIEAEILTMNNTGLTLNIAANYGGQWDILQATQKIAEKVANGLLSVEQINIQEIEKNLSTYGQSAVDLLIRTSGEQRVSNFLLWQIAYAEFYFSPLHWPDFDENEFLNAIQVFNTRERRFGDIAVKEV